MGGGRAPGMAHLELLDQVAKQLGRKNARKLREGQTAQAKMGGAPPAKTWRSTRHRGSPAQVAFQSRGRRGPRRIGIGL